MFVPIIPPTREYKFYITVAQLTSDLGTKSLFLEITVPPGGLCLREKNSYLGYSDFFQ